MFVLFLHGPAAAGKLTIARPLAKRLGLRLFHNHLTVDLSTALFDFGTRGFVELREDVWLKSFSLAAREGVSFVFTFQPEGSVGPTFPQDCRDAVERHGGRVHFVALDCPEAVVLGAHRRLVACGIRQAPRRRALQTAARRGSVRLPVDAGAQRPRRYV